MSGPSNRRKQWKFRSLSIISIFSNESGMSVTVCFDWLSMDTQNKKKLQALEQELGDIEASTVIWEKKLEDAQKERTMDPEKRAALEAELELQETKLKARRDKIEQHQGGDPAEYDEIVAGIEVAKQAAERWTDNIFAMIKLLRGKGIEKKDIYQAFSLSKDFDYLE